MVKQNLVIYRLYVKIVIKRSVCGIIENIRIIDVDTRPYLTSEDHCLEIAISANDITDITKLKENFKDNIVNTKILHEYKNILEHSFMIHMTYFLISL